VTPASKRSGEFREKRPEIVMHESFSSDPTNFQELFTRTIPSPADCHSALLDPAPSFAKAAQFGNPCHPQAGPIAPGPTASPAHPSDKGRPRSRCSAANPTPPMSSATETTAQVCLSPTSRKRSTHDASGSARRENHAFKSRLVKAQNHDPVMLRANHRT